MTDREVAGSIGERTEQRLGGGDQCGTSGLQQYLGRATVMPDWRLFRALNNGEHRVNVMRVDPLYRPAQLQAGKRRGRHRLMAIRNRSALPYRSNQKRLIGFNDEVEFMAAGFEPWGCRRWSKRRFLDSSELMPKPLIKTVSRASPENRPTEFRRHTGPRRPDPSLQHVGSATQQQGAAHSL